LLYNPGLEANLNFSSFTNNTATHSILLYLNEGQHLVASCSFVQNTQIFSESGLFSLYFTVVS
jgi:hypothetical protein